jgi:dipeptidyl-peptidase-3
MWVTDVSARVENNLLGFIEPYRDPAGIQRCEWEAMISIADVEEVKMKEFVDSLTTFIRQLPWAVAGLNDGKGPFEKILFDAPDF